MNDLPLAQPVTIIHMQPEAIAMLVLVAIAIAFLAGLVVGDWHGYRRRKHFDDEITSSFDLDLTLDGKPSPTRTVRNRNSADNEYMTNVYKTIGSKGRVIK